MKINRKDKKGKPETEVSDQEMLRDLDRIIDQAREKTLALREMIMKLEARTMNKRK